MRLTIRSCIPVSLWHASGGQGGGFGGAKQSALSVTESALTALWTEKIYPGDVYSLLRSCQKSQGLQPWGWPCPLVLLPRGSLRDKLTQSHLNIHSRPVHSLHLSHQIWVSAHTQKSWISFFNKNSSPSIFPEEINQFVAKKGISQNLTKSWESVYVCVFFVIF